MQSSSKKTTSKKKDVSYIAPNGEEIKSKKHLSKYLRAHSNGLKEKNFCWTSNSFCKGIHYHTKILHVIDKFKLY